MTGGAGGLRERLGLRERGGEFLATKNTKNTKVVTGLNFVFFVFFVFFVARNFGVDWGVVGGDNGQDCPFYVLSFS